MNERSELTDAAAAAVNSLTPEEIAARRALLFYLHPYFICETCPDENNAHAPEELRVNGGGVPMCESCWDETPDEMDWNEAPTLHNIPADFEARVTAEARVRELEAQRDALVALVEETYDRSSPLHGTTWQRDEIAKRLAAILKPSEVASRSEAKNPNEGGK